MRFNVRKFFMLDPDPVPADLLALRFGGAGRVLRRSADKTKGLSGAKATRRQDYQAD